MQEPTPPAVWSNKSTLLPEHDEEDKLQRTHPPSPGRPRHQGLVACISSGITTVIQVTLSWPIWTTTDLMSRPRSRRVKHSLDLDMHGLIFETSI